MSNKNEILFRAVGDIGPNRDEPSQCFELAAETLKQADITFCQLESNITDRGFRLPQVRHTHRSIPKTAKAIADAGFDVVSFASNHCMDWGPDGFFDTISYLKNENLDVVGVGANITEARKPVIKEINGVKTAFISACTILPPGFWADKNRAGCVPMRAYTLYEQVELDQPGTPARIHTFANREDLSNLCQDVKEAKKQADIVIVSLHWGIHFIPATIADYQREVAHAIIDAGADLILGHHAHIIKGVETYKNKVIFYSISNFAIDLPITPEHAQSKGFKEVQALSPGWEPDFESLYNFPPDSRMTFIVDAKISKDGINEIGVLPCFINRNAQPEVLKSSDDRFNQVANYIEWASQEAGLNAKFVKSGDKILIS